MNLRVMAESVSDSGNGSYTDYIQGQRIDVLQLGKDLQLSPLIFQYADVRESGIDVVMSKSYLGERISRSRNTVVNKLPESRRQITLSYPGDFVKARVGDIRYIFEAIR